MEVTSVSLQENYAKFQARREQEIHLKTKLKQHIQNLGPDDIKYLSTEYTDRDQKIIAKFPQHQIQLITCIQEFLLAYTENQIEIDLDEATEHISDVIYEKRQELEQQGAKAQVHRYFLKKGQEKDMLPCVNFCSIEEDELFTEQEMQDHIVLQDCLSPESFCYFCYKSGIETNSHKCFNNSIKQKIYREIETLKKSPDQSPTNIFEIQEEEFEDEDEYIEV